MKVLCIGNSFSQDATRYLEAISQNELFVRNCYIGGCSLEEHCRQLDGGEPFYEYQKDAEVQRMISLPEALRMERWDVVTVQQASGISGILESYEPFLSRLLEGVRSACPQAEIVFHRTWAYDKNACHPDFWRYDNNQEQMYEAICCTTNAVAEKYGLRVIPVGEAVQRARQLSAFDVEAGGIPLTRDGFHLSLDYGRYLAALVWCRFLTGRSMEEITFAPENTDPVCIEAIKQSACSD